MTIPTLTPLSCPICRSPLLLPEAELLRLPHTILFRCPLCQAVRVVDTTGKQGSPPSCREGDARAA